jgi:L-alanine-DL-glutamate epimerase-like enolase superfamily enzyme
MKVNRVRATAYAHRSFDGLVEIQTDEGISGIAIGTGDAGAAARKLGSDLLIGEDPRAVIALWQKMQSTGSGRAAIALLDLALWDLKAKIRGEPLWKTLGAARPRANAHISLDTSSPDFEFPISNRRNDTAFARENCASVRMLRPIRNSWQSFGVRFRKTRHTRC